MSNTYLNISLGGSNYTLVEILESRNELLDNIILSLSDHYYETDLILGKLCDVKSLDMQDLGDISDDELVLNVLGNYIDLDLDDLDYLAKFIPNIKEYTLADLRELLSNFEMTLLNPYRSDYKSILLENVTIAKIFYDPQLHNTFL